MNIFVAGVHGVGKTYLAKQLPESFGLIHTSASKLIKEARDMPNWGADKRVNDVDSNQIALAVAVKRHNDTGIRLLLDGHFVLLNAQGDFIRLDASVFKSLNLDRVILLEASPRTIAARIRDRDDRNADIGHIAEFIAIEREQALKVCDELGIPLVILESPSSESFIEAIVVTTQDAPRQKGTLGQT